MQEDHSHAYLKEGAWRDVWCGEGEEGRAGGA